MARSVGGQAARITDAAGGWGGTPAVRGPDAQRLGRCLRRCR
ncbi:hypothetical protein BSIN_5209 [Burkholderia singularis]|uniref:Uncharacterized protein n=1 Tax=Burkholderia singularis TaxID=1503053 RepID=A0A238HCR2_9BURK|nr:hypothetical protein BSIN_5209 [Burkholderia singularis]